jgi:hypothetical protein
LSLGLELVFDDEPAGLLHEGGLMDGGQEAATVMWCIS